jgi:hypothetical protein
MGDKGILGNVEAQTGDRFGRLYRDNPGPDPHILAIYCAPHGAVEAELTGSK